MSGKRYSLDTDDLVRRYLAGESEQAIARFFSCGRGAIRRRLLKAGISTRSYSAAQRVSNARLTPAERRLRADAAHTALRGARRSDIEMAKRAIWKQTSQRYVGKGERVLAQWLHDRGVECVPQLAMGRYNIDLAILPVAVELLYYTGNPLTRPIDSDKIKYLTDLGIHVLYVWINRRDVLTPEAADYIVAFCQEMRLSPSRYGQYRVIRGSGELVTVARSNPDDIPNI